MPESQSHLSPLHIFKYVQEYVEKTNVPPLTPNIITINKDQVSYLGDEGEARSPFARIGMGFPESNNQLLFALDFYESSVDVGFSGGEGAWIDYEEVGKTNKEVSTALINLLTVFSNGQLKILLTQLEEGEHIQAIEILYRAPHRTTYDTIGTSDMFLSSRELKNHTLKTSVVTNSAAIDEIKIDISKTQKLLLTGVDPEIMNEIGRKKIIDLDEPLSPEILKQRVDEYAEKIGERASVKVQEKFDSFDKSMGIQGMSVREQFVYFAKWRHIELMLWGFVMMTAYHWATWTVTEITLPVVLVGVALVPLYLLRKRYPYPKVLYILAPIGYVLFAIGAVIFFQKFLPHWVTWTIAIFAIMSIAENIFFDVYFIRQKIFAKIHNWAKK